MGINSKKASIIILLYVACTLCNLGVVSLALAESQVNLVVGHHRSTKTLLHWNDLLYRNVARQKFDYSCGSGSLATLMRIGFGENTTEEEVINVILQGKSKKEIQDIE